MQFRTYLTVLTQVLMELLVDGDVGSKFIRQWPVIPEKISTITRWRLAELTLLFKYTERWKFSYIQLGGSVGLNKRCVFRMTLFQALGDKMDLRILKASFSKGLFFRITKSGSNHFTLIYLTQCWFPYNWVEQTRPKKKNSQWMHLAMQFRTYLIVLTQVLMELLGDGDVGSKFIRQWPVIPEKNSYHNQDSV